MNEQPDGGRGGRLVSVIADHAFWIRWAAAVLVGSLVFLATPAAWPISTRLLTAWDVALLAALAFPWWVILHADPTLSRTTAPGSDPGRVGLLLISLVASVSSLAFAVNVLDDPGSDAGTLAIHGETALVVLAVLGGWLLLQTGYALHYARIYYGSAQDGGDPGLAFTDPPPDDLDFAYFAFGIGMAFETSDVTITTRGMRRVVLAHGFLSFLYNFAIFGLMVNLLSVRV